MKYINIIFTASLLLFSTGAFCQTKEIDFRTACETNAAGREVIYVMSFVAREKPFPGHAYVEWLAEDEQAQACIAEGYGKAPLNSDNKNLASIVSFKKVSGYVRREGIDATGVKLFVKVDRRLFQKSISIARGMNLLPGAEYRLLDNDCVEFVKKIAQFTGLKVPKRGPSTLTPSMFMTAFIKLNSEDSPISVAEEYKVMK